jgi:hypothetical protein
VVLIGVPTPPFRWSFALDRPLTDATVSLTGTRIKSLIRVGLGSRNVRTIERAPRWWAGFRSCLGRCLVVNWIQGQAGAESYCVGDALTTAEMFLSRCGKGSEQHGSQSRSTAGRRILVGRRTKLT